MEQEIQCTLHIQKTGISNYTNEMLQKELKDKLENPATKIKVRKIFTQDFLLDVTGSLRATWKLGFNRKTKCYIIDHMLQGITLCPGEVRIQALLQEKEIYGNN